MRKSRTVGVVSLALGLLFGAAQVTAGPVLTLAADGTFGNSLVKEEIFSDTYSSFHLDSARTITGYLSTQVNQQLDIEDVYLVMLSASGKAIDSTRIGFKEVLSIDWSAKNPKGVERWELNSEPLAAGDWQLQVKGEGLAGKYGLAYTGAIQIDSKVPEPQTLALSLLALAAMAGLTWRRKSAR